jgi:neutral ceramidase
MRRIVLLSITALVVCVGGPRVATVGAVALAQHGVVRAGAAMEDITPLPGLSTAGHGPESVSTTAYWDRLRVTAFYFEDRAGEGAVLVSADLFGIPGGLHDAIAAHFATPNLQDGGIILPRERIVLAATHTHQGPGNYLSADLYNNFASKLFSRFNPSLRQFLQQRFIRAIVRAALDARSSADSSVDVVTGTLSARLLMNRSPGVFMQDRNSATILAAYGRDIPSDATACAAARDPLEPGDWKQDGCPRLRGVDRNVTLLRIRRAGRTHAFGVFLNAHPTVIPADTRVYSGDVFGQARVQLESVGEVPSPLVAFFNGSEGDVVMRRTTRTAGNVVALASMLAREIRDIHDGATPSVIDLSSGVRGRLHFARGGEVAAGPGGTWRLAARPMFGVAAPAGAEGDQTFLAWLFPPTTEPARGEHGVKVPAFGRVLGELLGDPDKFPRALPLGILRLGAFTVATLPVEPSTAAVWRIRAALGSPPHGTVEVVSLANEYASYMTTDDEYDVQDYMGASTAWGPQQAGFFAATLRRVDGEADGVSGTPGPDAPGPLGSFEHVVRRTRPIYRDFEHFLRGGLVAARSLPAFEWCAPPPSDISAGERHIEVRAVDGTQRDASGVLTILRHAPSGALMTWGAIWLTPLWAQRQGQYQFVVIEGDRTIVSRPFNVGTSPPSVCRP